MNDFNELDDPKIQDELNDPEIQDSARALAEHIASHPASVVMAAMRDLGWRLTFELKPKEEIRRESLIQYYEPPNEYDPATHVGEPIVFLAGGITHCPDWQSEAVRLIEASGPGVTIFNPRRKNFPIADPAAGWEQVSWEQRHLHTSRVHTLFWFPACDPALTTQPIAMFELGQALGERRPITVGVDPGYPRAADVEMLCRLNDPDLVVHKRLADTVSTMLERSDWVELFEEKR